MNEVKKRKGARSGATYFEIDGELYTRREAAEKLGITYDNMGSLLNMGATVDTIRHFLSMRIRFNEQDQPLIDCAQNATIKVVKLYHAWTGGTPLEKAILENGKGVELVHGELMTMSHIARKCGHSFEGLRYWRNQGMSLEEIYDRFVDGTLVMPKKKVEYLSPIKRGTIDHVKALLKATDRYDVRKQDGETLIRLSRVHDCLFWPDLKNAKKLYEQMELCPVKRTEGRRDQMKYIAIDDVLKILKYAEGVTE